MHSYLRAVGFPEIRGKSDMDRLIREVIASCDEKIVVDEGDNRLFAELSRDFGYNIGITVCGAYDEKDEFQAEYCFPFFRGTGITSGEDVAVERHAEKESFAGACDDVRIGVTLIFYLQNAGEYLDARYKGALDRSRTTVTLSGLSVEGKVLLPVKKGAADIGYCLIRKKNSRYQKKKQAYFKSASENEGSQRTVPYGAEKNHRQYGSDLFFCRSYVASFYHIYPLLICCFQITLLFYSSGNIKSM